MRCGDRERHKLTAFLSSCNFLNILTSNVERIDVSALHLGKAGRADKFDVVKGKLKINERTTRISGYVCEKFQSKTFNISKFSKYMFVAALSVSSSQ